MISRPAPRSLALSALAALLAAPAAAQPITEPKTPYELVLEAAIAALPEAPGGFIRAHRPAIQDVVFRDSARPPTPALAPEWQGHFLLLDAAATETDWSVRLSAAKSFPRAKKDARKLFQERGVKEGGDLPWLLEDQYAKLVAALRKNDAAAAEGHIGLIIHLATDAALPFNTSTLAIDELAEKPADQESPSGRRLRDRFHGTFIDRLKSRLAYEVRVSPLRVQTIASPADAAFDTLLQAHRTALELAEIDAETIRVLGPTDLDAFAASADVYVAALAEAVAPMLENQIESGALLAANLILTAWNAARPNFANDKSPSELGAKTVPQTERPQADGGDAGSTSSSERAHSPPTASSQLPTTKPGQTEAIAPAIKPSGPRETAFENRRNLQPASDQKSPSPEAPPASALLGSLGSTVYHRGDCSHVARIKPENRVEFKTKTEAEAAGRKPCRACKPDLETSPSIPQEKN